VNAHRGEPANEEGDIQADKVEIFFMQRCSHGMARQPAGTHRAVFTWQEPRGGRKHADSQFFLTKIGKMQSAGVFVCAE